MSRTMERLIWQFRLFALLCSLCAPFGCTQRVGADANTVTPTPWPLQFHALAFINSSSGTLQATDLWYDWPNGRNFNIIHNQLKNVLHDLEWTNGTSFYYDLDAGTCQTRIFDVGILRPDWLVDNSTYIGQQSYDGFTCNVWEKADFIVYYEDVDTKRPVGWIFYTGMTIHLMSFEEGAVLADSEWQAPAYCFEEEDSVLGKQKVIETENEPWRKFLANFGNLPGFLVDDN
ncbi:hypothetical protein KP509_39G053700 [Ceratopteris richardii]|uniref:Lipoprotein n=1 Tax=Ceratopteris richardii TaxID=49495 RepID=A0A8T2Q1C1_CERRI|nr:hypothetical protein KP509_39G053700 [Ceratopteris richardii]